jgi:hypothetical protein
MTCTVARIKLEEWEKIYVAAENTPHKIAVLDFLIPYFTSS